MRKLRHTLIAAWGCWLAATYGGAWSATVAPESAHEPAGQSFASADVERVGHRQLALILQDARSRNALGCREQCARLEAIFERLLPVFKAQSRRAATLPWTLTVVQLAHLEALSLPGGQIVISEAFVRARALSDDALAFVLAHEMSHAVFEHERHTLTLARHLLPRDRRLSIQDVYTEIDGNPGLLKSLEPSLQQSESEADERGFLLASAAGFSPEGQLSFLASQVAAGDTERGPVRTHPSSRDRLQALQARLPLAQRLFTGAQQAAVP